VKGFEPLAYRLWILHRGRAPIRLERHGSDRALERRRARARREEVRTFRRYAKRHASSDCRRGARVPRRVAAVPVARASGTLQAASVRVAAVALVVLVTALVSVVAAGSGRDRARRRDVRNPAGPRRRGARYLGAGYRAALVLVGELRTGRSRRERVPGIPATAPPHLFVALLASPPRRRRASARARGRRQSREPRARRAGCGCRRAILAAVYRRSRTWPMGE